MGDQFMEGFVLVLSPVRVNMLVNQFSSKEFEYLFTGIVRNYDHGSKEPQEIEQMGIYQNFDHFNKASRISIKDFKLMLNFSGCEVEKNKAFFYASMEKLGDDQLQKFIRVFLWKLTGSSAVDLINLATS
jgi:hypothetical protein